MTPAGELLQRLRWDPRLEPGAFRLGIHDRSRGVVEISFLNWDPQGDIPTHRVRYIRCQGQLVWDRDSGLDLFHNLPPAAWKSSQQRWGDSLRLVVWNVLSFAYEPPGSDSQTRLEAILAQLDALQYDVAALIEATPELLEALQRPGWHFSSGNLSPYGTLIMSRLPFEQTEVRFSEHKRALFARWDDLTLAVVHLPTRDEELQQSQLSRTLEQLPDTGTRILAGDFNRREPHRLPLADLWEEQHPGDPGLTFDPQHNRLARLTCRNPAPARFDRILLAPAAAPGFRALSIERFGLQNPASDHYGLVLDLRRAGREPSRASALAIVPPRRLWAPIQAIRREHDRAFRRWPPHINLLWPFLPDGELERLHGLDHELEVTLTGYASFPQGTVYLRVHCPGLDELLERLQERFPECQRVGVPHLTVSQSLPLPGWEPLSFRVDALTWLAGDPMRARGRHWLGVVERVRQACGRVEVVGSARLGLAHADSDLDLLVDTDLERLAEALGGELALDAQRPVLRLPGVDISAGDAQALQHARAFDALPEAFGELALAVDAWARSRALHGQGYGWPGGYSWRLLAARAWGERTELEGDPLDFFLLQRHDLSDLRGLLPSTRALLQGELERGERQPAALPHPRLSLQHPGPGWRGAWLGFLSQLETVAAIRPWPGQPLTGVRADDPEPALRLAREFAQRYGAALTVEGLTHSSG